MPDGILPDEGIADQLEYILKRSISGVLAWKLMLFKNDIEPDAATVFADLEEADFDGYIQFELARDQWTTPDVHEGCATSTWTTEPIQWYVLGGPEQTIYGYAMFDVVESKLRFVQRFDEDDIEPLQIGGKVVLLPRYTLTSAACGGA